MKNVLRADFFELRKSKMVFLLPIFAVLLGFLMPLMYYGIKALFEYIAGMEAVKDNPSIQSMVGALGILDARTVFASTLPLSQGFGLMLTAMIGFRAARPFGTGVYRNKVIVGTRRSAIYLSQSLICLLLSIAGAAIYTLSAALMSRLTFGPLDLSGREILCIAALTFGVYLVYTAIPVFTAFFSRSVPLTLIVSMVLPILTQTVISLVTPVISFTQKSVPEAFLYIMSAFPSFQGVIMTSSGIPTAVLLIALIADIVWAALLTLFGVLRFRKADIK